MPLYSEEELTAARKALSEVNTLLAKSHKLTHLQMLYIVTKMELNLYQQLMDTDPALKDIILESAKKRQELVSILLEQYKNGLLVN